MPTLSLRDTAKQWFQSGDKPTQSQFWQFLDSIWFKDELLQISNIDGLTPIINALANPLTSYTKNTSAGTTWPLTVEPGFMVEFIIPIPQSDRLSTLTIDGVDKFTDGALPALKGDTWPLFLSATDGQIHIEISDLPENTKIIVISRKIN